MAYKFGKHTQLVEQLFKDIRLVSQSHALCDLYEIVWQVTCLKAHQKICLDYAASFLPLLCQNLRDCMAQLSDEIAEGNRMPMTDNQIYSWVTSMMGILKNITVHYGSLNLFIYELSIRV